MPVIFKRYRTAALIGAVLASLTVGVVVAPAAQAATCSDVDIVFARGTGEAAGLGTVGKPFVSALTADLAGRTVTSYAVNYAANTSQTSAGPGSTDMTNHVTSVAALCPGTTFVLGGYSQGATVADKAIGIQTGSGTGTAIPANLASRVAAVVVFGNPLGLSNQTIATASATYGPKSVDYCNSGDPVCGGGGNISAHLQYASNGSTTRGATFAANLVLATATNPGTPTPTPTPAAACVTATNSAHVDAGRATSLFGRAYAIGSRDSLGYNTRFVTTSLRQTNATTWTLVSGC